MTSVITYDLMLQMEVLFEYKGSKRTIKCTSSELCDRVCGELNTHGVSDATVGFAGTSTKKFILQCFSQKWNDFIDVDKLADITNGDCHTKR